MKRRDFLCGLSGAAAAWPLTARAQQSARPVIGFLSASNATGVAPNFLPAFRQGLRQTGYVEGQNLAIEYRWAEGRYDWLPNLAVDLVSRQVSLIVATGGSGAALAAKAATSTMPIVFNLGADPLKLGLVASLNRPGGNITGVSYLSATLEPKRLEILHELLPGIANVAVLANPKFADTDTQDKESAEAARTIGKNIVTLNASAEREIEHAFSTAAEQVKAILVQAKSLGLTIPITLLGRADEVIE